MLASGVILNHELHIACHGNFSTFRTTKQRRAKFVKLDLEVSGNGRQDVDVSAGCSHLERVHSFGTLLDVNELPGLEAVRRTINELTVNKNVAVHHHLTRLCRGACNSRAHDECVKAHFKKLDEVLTGQAGRLTGLLEDATQLRLTNAILGTKSLLFAKANGIVRISLALCAPVLAGSIGTLFEVLGCLGGQGNTQSPREAGLTTCA
jgi:hypothetical protein